MQGVTLDKLSTSQRCEDYLYLICLFFVAVVFSIFLEVVLKMQNELFIS